MTMPSSSSRKLASSLRKPSDSSSPTERRKNSNKVVGFGPPTLISVPSSFSLQTSTLSLIENPLLWASIGWCITGASLQSMNKLLLEQVPRPLTLVTVQLGVTCCAGLLSWLVRPSLPRRLKKRHWMQLGHAGAWNALGAVLWMVTLSAAPISHATLWKTTQSSMMALFVPGSPSFAAGLLAHVPWLGVAFDVLLREADVPYPAIIFGLASNLAFVGRTVASARLSQKRFAGASNLFTMLCLASFCILFPIAWMWEGMVEIELLNSPLALSTFVGSDDYEMPLYEWLLLSGGLFWFSNELLFYVSDQARASVRSRQALVWADTARRCCVLLVCHFVIGETLPNLWSLQLALGSLILYKLGQQRQNNQSGGPQSDQYDSLIRRSRFDSDGWSLANDSLWSLGSACYTSAATPIAGTKKQQRYQQQMRNC